MNKKDLVNLLVKDQFRKKDASDAVDKIFETITAAMANGESVTIIGFGTFKPVKREARKCRNPQTGAEIQIPAKTAPKFVPGKAMKEAVNK